MRINKWRRFQSISKYEFLTKKFALASIAGAFLLSAAALAVPAVYAANDNAQGGPNFDPARHEVMEQVVEAGDYDAWATLMKDGPRGEEMLKVITEDNFAKFAEAHELMEKARAINKELVLPGGKMGKGGLRGEKGEFKGGRGNCVVETNESVD